MPAKELPPHTMCHNKKTPVFYLSCQINRNYHQKTVLAVSNNKLFRGLYFLPQLQLFKNVMLCFDLSKGWGGQVGGLESIWATLSTLVTPEALSYHSILSVFPVSNYRTSNRKYKIKISSLISYKPLSHSISLSRDTQLMRCLLPGNWFL